MTAGATTDGPADVLLRIYERRRERFGVARGAFDRPVVPDGGAVTAEAPNPFCDALAQRRGEAIIAEVKLGSPKLGSLVGSFDPEEQARSYAEAGAAALSVVVEPDFFWGSYEILARCREASGLPTIAKDFLVSPRQLESARDAGASAILLIAALYDTPTLRAYAAGARALGLVPLVETHGAADLAKLDDGEWELVGVNNRDLRTFEVCLQHSVEMMPALPATALKVAESGIHDRDDVVTLQHAGFDAFLIGEALITAGDPRTKLAELLGRAS